MLRVTDTEIATRLRFENPWWDDTAILDRLLEGMRDRAYLAPFFELVTNRAVRRAVVLMGPRRVGKTVMLRQVIRKLMTEKEVPPQGILFASLENPIYRGLSLAKILDLYMAPRGHGRFADLYVIFDEIQYVEEWEAHLKSLVDDFPNIRFVVSGSAAAALRMKSRESGAGRFTDFLLPPLLFTEFLDFVGAAEGVGDRIDELNTHFVDYINFGGFPEAITNRDVRADLPRFIASDIIDKVLLRDLPSLYGIDSPNELHRFFSSLVYNTGQELSIGELSKDTGIPKNTIYKYFEYLEAAFLIHRLRRIDQSGRRPQRETGFKVYVTNPSLRAALYGPVGTDDALMGKMAETAIIAQLMHSQHIDKFYFARWADGEVDLVGKLGSGKIISAYEIKWSDRISRDSSCARHIVSFAKKNGISEAFMMSRAFTGIFNLGGVELRCHATSWYCKVLGEKFAADDLRQGIHPRRLLPDLPE
jgi:predicted AAA+ superfamily ATPase